MGMNRHDSYYEPDDYDDRSDEIEERAWQLMKVGAKFDYRTTGAIAEALSECSKDEADAIQDIIDSGDYEALGRKLIGVAMDYMEGFAKEIAEFEIND